MSEIIKVPMHRIQSMPQYQSRASSGLDPKAVEEYAERYRNGQPMDPIKVCGQKHMTFFVVDGHHRFEGMKRAGYGFNTLVEVEIVDARQDAATIYWCASGANLKHGIKRTNADKRRAVEMALESRPEAGDETIADHCGVSRMFVYNVRKEKGIPSPQTAQIEAKQAEAVALVEARIAEGTGRNAVVFSNNDTSSEEPAGPVEPAEERGTTPPAEREIPPPPPSPPQTRWPKRADGEHVLLKDAAFRIIPAEYREYYLRRGEVMSVKKKLSDLLAELRAGIRAKDPLWSCINDSTIAQLKNVIEDVEDCMPLYLCPCCSGLNPGCDLCGNRNGFIGRKEYNAHVKPNPKLLAMMERAAKKGKAEAGQEERPQ